MRARNYSLCGTLHAVATILDVLSATGKLSTNGLLGDRWMISSKPTLYLGVATGQRGDSETGS